MLQIHECNIKRLNGNNIFFDGYGALLDIMSNDPELVQFRDAFIADLSVVIEKLNLPAHVFTKTYTNGTVVAIKMPFDLRDFASGLLEKVYGYSLSKFDNNDTMILDIDKIDCYYKDSINLKLRETNEIATKRLLNFFEVEGSIYIGSGKGCYHLELSKLDHTDIPWDDIYEIPSVMVTGTNGKTTTVRLTNYIAKTSGLITGYCSTDWVMIDGVIIDEGDYSGIQGNHLVLKDTRVDVAILEVARGGIVKRGLATRVTSAALVTNVTEDHLGQGVIDTLEQLANAKFIVHNSVKPGGHSIINLDDAMSLQLLPTINNDKIYTSQQLSLDKIKCYLQSDREYAIYVRDGAIYLYRDACESFVVNLNQVSITYNGLASHNVYNVLSAIALSLELGVSLDNIASALASYVNDDTTNQGRFNIFDVNGSMFIFDYGHNVAAINSIVQFAGKLKPQGATTTILLGFTGDRRSIVEEVVKVVFNNKVDKVILKKFDNYLRGWAEKGEVANYLHKCLINVGFAPEDIIAIVDEELEAVQLAVSRAKPGDINLMLVQEEITIVLNYMKKIEVKNNVRK